MIVKLQLKIVRRYFEWILKGVKTVEGRLKKPGVASLKPGDIIEFITEPWSTAKAQVTYVKEYKSFKEMLLDQGVKNCLPDLSDLEEGVRVYHSFPGYQESESHFGVIAIGIKKV